MAFYRCLLGAHEFQVRPIERESGNSSIYWETYELLNNFTLVERRTTVLESFYKVEK